MRYFYNTFGSHWHIRLWYAFFPNETRPSSIDVGLIKLAKKGFLLIDSLPFAMKYSSTVRNKPLYFQLVKECLPFLMNKVNNHSITWAKNVRLAFAFKLNALAVIKALPSGLALPTNEVIQLHEQLIAADGSGYTNSNMLRNILGID
ncbi:MAG: hypothetical protein KKG06_01520 [Bacteroidetes bacterium]|nr:hypothetical protein [Bacteroidota bacterium]